MRSSICNSELKGRVSAPASKSYTIRGLVCAALAKGGSEIIHPLTSDDTEAALNVLGKVGIDIRRERDVLIVRRRGKAWFKSGDHPKHTGC